MTKQTQVYKCALCGNIVGVLHEAAGELVCCGQPMNLLAENTTDAATEKHVPVLERTAEGITVKVGEVAHPMADDHFIEWIGLLAGGAWYIKFLKPGDTPEATFPTTGTDAIARAYCNLHGFWKA